MGQPYGYHMHKGGVHIRGEICPRSDPDIAHMRYYLGPLKLKGREKIYCNKFTIKSKS